MTRFRLLVVALLLVGTGFALARLLPGEQPASPAPAEPAPGFDASLPLAERVRELERAVAEERRARQLLEDELLYLSDLLEDRDDEYGNRDVAGPVAEVPDVDVAPRRRFGDNREGRLDALVRAGLSAERAEWIMQRESRYQLAMLEARHDASREGDWEDYQAFARAEREAFRADLGDDYERYLEGSGRPTAVVVSGIMDTSPAQRAGLQPGDRILQYGAKRIYSMSDLNQATLDGAPGETVLLQIERDGMPMQIAIPRGPVGIMAGGRRRE